MGRRAWVKKHVEGWLRGSIRAEHFSVRALFDDLLAMAGDSAYGDSGIIQLAEGVGFTDEVLAGILNFPVEVFRESLSRLNNHPDPDENRVEIITGKIGYCIRILKWNEYQSEYERQKPYRVEKLQRKLQGGLRLEGEGERDREGEEELREEECVKAHTLVPVQVQSPIPDGEKEPETKPENKSKEISEVWAFFRQRSGKNYQLTEKRKKRIRESLALSTTDEMKQAILGFLMDDWIDRPKFDDPAEYALKTREQIEKWVERGKGNGRSKVQDNGTGAGMARTTAGGAGECQGGAKRSPADIRQQHVRDLLRNSPHGNIGS